MAEGIKQEDKKEGGSKAFAAFFKVVLGLALLAAAAYLLIGRMWWNHTFLVIKGCAGPFLALAGIITLAIAKE
jgi:hypothetical protein